MTADVEYSVPIVIFRFFPAPEAELVRESHESPIISYVKEVAESVESEVNASDYDIDAEYILDRQIELSNELINNSIKELNNDTDAQYVGKYWYDNEVVSILCIDNKCWIERGEILDVEDEMLKNVVQDTYRSTGESTLRILIFFVNVYDKRKHNHMVVYPDYDEEDYDE